MKVIDVKSNTNANSDIFVNEHNEDIKKWVYCKETDTVYKGVGLCANMLSIDKNNIRHCLKGKRKSVGGYHIRYLTIGELDKLNIE